MEFEAMHQATEANLARNTRRVSYKFGTSQYLQNLSKSIQICQIVPNNIEKLLTHPSSNNYHLV